MITSDELFSIQASSSIVFLASALCVLICHFLLNNLFLHHGKQLSTNTGIFYVPKRWFYHYYIIATLSTATLRILLINSPISNASIALVLFFGHSLRRLYESLFFPVSRYSNSINRRPSPKCMFFTTYSVYSTISQYHS
jgi:hypothetical protein